jgi:undecaprenyl-diphosphatase
MNALLAGFLGIVQGLTEFFPVSSSGHLVLFQKLIPGFSQPGMAFDVILHFATLFAVLFYFRNDIPKLSLKYVWFLGVGTIPAVIVGLLFKNQIEAMFDTGSTLWIEFMISGLINLGIWRMVTKAKEINTKNSFVTGIAQAIAIIPAISRSGATIFSGVAQGIKPEEAVKFSFLMSVPAVLGANILELTKFTGNLGTFSAFEYLIGFFFAFVAGFIAIKLVTKLLLNKKFLYFAIYCFVIGGVALLIK